MTDSRIEYHSKSGQKLKYSVCKADGTPKGAPLHPLPESQTPGYYTTISYIHLEKDDRVLIYGPDNVLYDGEPLTYDGGFVTTDEPVGKGEFSAEAQAKEQPWDKDDPNYMPISDAVKDAKRKGRRVSVTGLSRSLTPDGQMRYMRKYTPQGKPSRCRVHIGDFRQYRKTLASSDDPFSEEAFKARQERIRKQKEAKGTGRETKKGGLDKLLGDIETR